jgi:hypothetical protein
MRRYEEAGRAYADATKILEAVGTTGMSGAAAGSEVGSPQTQGQTSQSTSPPTATTCDATSMQHDATQFEQPSFSTGLRLVSQLLMFASPTLKPPRAEALAYIPARTSLHTGGVAAGHGARRPEFVSGRDGGLGGRSRGQPPGAGCGGSCGGGGGGRR